MRLFNDFNFKLLKEQLGTTKKKPEQQCSHPKTTFEEEISVYDIGVQ